MPQPHRVNGPSTPKRMSQPIFKSNRDAASVSRFYWSLCTQFENLVSHSLQYLPSRLIFRKMFAENCMKKTRNWAGERDPPWIHKNRIKLNLKLDSKLKTLLRTISGPVRNTVFYTRVFLIL